MFSARANVNKNTKRLVCLWQVNVHAWERADRGSLILIFFFHFAHRFSKVQNTVMHLQTQSLEVEDKLPGQSGLPFKQKIFQ